jgi:hypothetical protein
VDLGTPTVLCPTNQGEGATAKLMDQLHTRSGTYSATQNVNQRNDEQILRLSEKRRRAVELCKNCLKLANDQVPDGGQACWEWPRNCHAWGLDFAQKKMIKYSIARRGLCDACQVGVVEQSTREPAWKKWSIASTSEIMASRMELVRPDPKNHNHGRLEGASDVGVIAYYPKPFAVRFCRVVLGHDNPENMERAWQVRRRIALEKCAWVLTWRISLRVISRQMRMKKSSRDVRRLQ